MNELASHPERVARTSWRNQAAERGCAVASIATGALRAGRRCKVLSGWVHLHAGGGLVEQKRSCVRPNPERDEWKDRRANSCSRLRTLTRPHT